MLLNILAKVSLIYFIFIIITYAYLGVTSIPSEGDSLNYHIPLALSYLDLNIINPENITNAVMYKYFPATGQFFLALFYITGVSPNLFNVLGVVLLAVSSYYLARGFGLEKSISTVFAISIGTLHTVLRWLNAQTIDIWLAVFFTLCLTLLNKPKKSTRYFLLLGTAFGLLIGAKFTGLIFAGILGILYFHRLIRYLNLKNIFSFLIPCSLIGFSWYIRNLVLTGNPIYPEGFWIFQGPGKLLEYKVYMNIIDFPIGTIQSLNAFLSEYMLWVVSPIIAVAYIVFTFYKRSKIDQPLLILLLVGLSNLLFFMYLTSAKEFHIMLSVMRYSYPAFIPLTLGMFILAVKFKRSDLIAIIALSNMFVVGFPHGYNPKILVVYLPISYLIFYHTFSVDKNISVYKITRFLKIKRFNKS